MTENSERAADGANVGAMALTPQQRSAALAAMCHWQGNNSDEMLNAMLDELCAAIGTAGVALADAERLDWLEANAGAWFDGGLWYGKPAGTSRTRPRVVAPNLRAAIDAAAKENT